MVAEAVTAEADIVAADTAVAVDIAEAAVHAEAAEGKSKIIES